MFNNLQKSLPIMLDRDQEVVWHKQGREQRNRELLSGCE